MNLNIVRQERYARSELLLRTFFGVFYIVIPHAFLLLFLSLWSNILSFIAFWVILFTGKYPLKMFDYQAQLMRWQLRLYARLLNLSDGYPTFGLRAQDNYTTLVIDYPERISRKLTIMRLLFGTIYVVLPHFFILFFRTLWGAILSFLAFWVVLFTAEYPAHWHAFLVENIRWEYRVKLYLTNMTDEYPPFSGKA